MTGAPVRNARQRVEAMVAVLRHRGPDAKGIYVASNGRAAIGNTRLAIVDPGTSFVVPMTSKSGHGVLSFNGEIYNFREERQRLESSGSVFRTKSDTEVLLEGLEREGQGFLGRLDGVWGFAYYDVLNQRLILGRDVMGERHIFYTMHSGEISFASEIEALLSVLPNSPDLCPDGIRSAFKYRATAPAHTLLESVWRLRPGEVATLDREGNLKLEVSRRLHPEKWFDYFNRNPSPEEVSDLISTQLLEACRARISLETSFSAALSGGIDSTLVNMAITTIGHRQYPTLFGISTQKPMKLGDDIDEQTASETISRRLQTDHHEFSMLTDDVVSVYQAHASRCFDGILCESVVAFALLAGAARSVGTKVLLLSDGPDELASGYPRDISVLFKDREFPEKTFGRRLLARAASTNFVAGLLERYKRLDLINLTETQLSPFRFEPIHGGTTRLTLSQIFENDGSAQHMSSFGTIPRIYSDIISELDLSQRMSLSYATTSLPDYFNLRSDRGTNSASVETRLPLQAPKLAELMIAMPQRYRVSELSVGKQPLRQLVERAMGPEIAYRQKYGFAHPGWHVPRISRALNIESVIRESPVFDSPPFRACARSFILRPDQARLRWFAYCLAATHARLKSQRHKPDTFAHD